MWPVWRFFDHYMRDEAKVHVHCGIVGDDAERCFVPVRGVEFGVPCEGWRIRWDVAGEPARGHALDCYVAVLVPDRQAVQDVERIVVGGVREVVGLPPL